MSLVDFHMHSSASDGALSPEALMALAHTNGVKALALTDHDTTAGLAPARARAEALGLALVPGVEISCAWAGQSIHLVALGFDETHAGLQVFLAEQVERRRRRFVAFDERFGAEGLPEVMPTAKRIAGKGSVLSRAHIASALVQLGVVPDRESAFRRYIGQGCPCYVAMDWPSIFEGIAITHEAGGLSVLAHPGRYRFASPAAHDAFIESFVRAQGDAIEVSSGSQKGLCTPVYACVAERYGLWASTGSDFHRIESERPGPGGQPPLPPEVRPIWRSPTLARFCEGLRVPLSLTPHSQWGRSMD